MDRLILSRSILLVLVALGSGLEGGSAAELELSRPEEVGMSSSVLARVKPALQSFVDDGKVAGAVAVVLRKDRVVLFEAVGWRDIAERKPMERDAIFRIYSMTKPITSVAVMLLAEQGLIDLDAPVDRYLPELRERDVLAAGGSPHDPARRQITTRDLLRHTSGLTYGFYGDTAVDRQYLAANLLSRDSTLAEMLTKLQRLPLVCHPGERFVYSVSTDVLARLVEVVAAQSFDAFIETRIFQPLGMTETSFAVRDADLPRFTTNYRQGNDGKLQPIDSPGTSPYRQPPQFLSGGGGLVSTASDYVRFCRMLQNRGELEGVRLLRPESVGAMTVNQLVGPAYPISIGKDRRDGVGFGLGFSVIVERIPGAEYVPIGEYGWGGAASTHFWISPAHDLAVVVLSQTMPFTLQLESAVKPIVYEALERPGK
ncbi:MAG: serine hydrolase domain-containing protein [Planctomycetales bacterium]